MVTGYLPPGSIQVKVKHWAPKTTWLPDQKPSSLHLLLCTLPCGSRSPVFELPERSSKPSMEGFELSATREDSCPQTSQTHTVRGYRRYMVRGAWNRYMWSMWTLRIRDSPASTCCQAGYVGHWLLALNHSEGPQQLSIPSQGGLAFASRRSSMLCQLIPWFHIPNA